ncbi:MAG TPA: MarR family transcriptional regulator [Acidimicrobiales bacterium]|nr:MarR family transcriptional regulator [Acidimicrobiales bacterium]
MPARNSEAAPEVVDALLAASRVLVAVAARSLSAAEEEVTLAQYRTLVVLASRGPQRVADLAAALAVTPATATRMCDRLVHKQLIRRRTEREDRRQVRVALTERGRELVDAVTARRRLEIAEIVKRIPAGQQQVMIEALQRFAESAGEIRDEDWASGWDL